MKMKKILVFILLTLFTLGILTPSVSALQNTNYKFLQWGLPSWVDYPYDISFSDWENSLSLSWSLYPKYNNALINYVPYTTSLKRESWYKGLAWLQTLVFVEPSKLKVWNNRIVWAKYHPGVPTNYITSDNSPFWVDIECENTWICKVFWYVGLNYAFDNNFYASSLRNKTFTQRSRYAIPSYQIDKDSDQDFMLLLNFEYSELLNNETNFSDWRIQMSILTETWPWSWILKKITDSTNFYGTFIWPIRDNSYLWYQSIYLDFLDYTKVYSLDYKIIQDDIKKINSKFNNSTDQSVYESYYRSMKNNMFAYLLELWFGMTDPTSEDLENIWISASGSLDFSKLQKWETDFQFQKCENLEILCHIKNSVWYFSYKIWQIFSAIFWPIFKFFWSFFKNLWDWVKSIFSWIWEWIKTLFSPITFIADQLWSNINFAFKSITSLFFTDTAERQILSCDANFNYAISEEKRDEADLKFSQYIQDTYPWFLNPMYSFSDNIFTLYKFISPITPRFWQEICTYAGMKPVIYLKNTFVDVFFVLICVFSLLSLLLNRPRD